MQNVDKISSSSIRHINELITYSQELEQKLEIRRTPKFKGGKAALIESNIDFQKLPTDTAFHGQSYNLRKLVKQLIDYAKKVEQFLENA